MPPIAQHIRTRTAALVFALATAVAPLQVSSDAETNGVTATTIKVGVLGSLTGPGAIFGTGNLAGITIVADKVNAAGGIYGRKIELVSVDDQSSPQQALAAYKRLIDQDHVFAVFGPATSAVSQALAPTLREAQTPSFLAVPSTPAVTEPVSKHIFRTGPLNDRLQGAVIADYVLDNLKAKRIALIRESDEYGKRGAEGLNARLESRRSPVVAEEVFDLTDSDFSGQLSKVLRAQPDVLVVYGYPNPSAVITRQARQLGITARIMGSNTVGSRRYGQIVGQAAIGTQNILTLEVLPESMDTAARRVQLDFEQRFPAFARQGRPDLGDNLAYGGALAFVEGLRRAGRDLTDASFIAALETLHDFRTGVTLPTTFSTTDHDGNKSARVVEIQGDLSRKLLPIVLHAR